MLKEIGGKISHAFDIVVFVSVSLIVLVIAIPLIVLCWICQIIDGKSWEEFGDE